MLGLTGCGRSPEKQNGSIVVERSEIRIVVITHGQASDPFWSVVKNGVDAAAATSLKLEKEGPFNGTYQDILDKLTTDYLDEKETV